MVNKDEIIAAVTSDIRNWWESQLPPKGPLEKYCLWWSKFTVENLRKAGIKAIINAGSASWIVDKENTYSYEFIWNTLALAQINSSQLPEMHVWVIVPPEECPEDRGQIIDLTTQYLLQLAKEVVPSACINYPALWCHFDELPNNVVYYANRQATELAMAILDFEQTRVFSFRILELLRTK